ncbi:MAG: adaptor protein MecA [Eubacteriales bacterium]|jgi:hypothetical protein
MEPFSQPGGYVRIVIHRSELSRYGLPTADIPCPSRELLLAALAMARKQPGFPAAGTPLQVELSLCPEGLTLLFMPRIRPSHRWRPVYPQTLQRLRRAGCRRLPLLYSFHSIEEVIALAYALPLSTSQCRSSLFWMDDRYWLRLTVYTRRDTQAVWLRRLTAVLGEYGRREEKIILQRLEEQAQCILSGDALGQVCRLFVRRPV